MECSSWTGFGSRADQRGLAMCCMRGKDAKSMKIKLAEGSDAGRESVRIFVLADAFVQLDLLP
jgi:hypothetical protein